MRPMILIASAITFSVATTIIDNPASDTIAINVSSHSVNRIVLPAKVLDIAYSKEKGVDIKIVDNQAFIKYVPIQKEQVQVIAKDRMEKVGEPEIIYHKAKSSELFVVTERGTYAFALNPKNIEAQTIIVNSFGKKTKEILKYETEDSHVATLTKISEQIFKGSSPQGYKVKQINRPIDSYFKEGLIAKEVSTYEGVIYMASLIEVENRTNNPQRLDPKSYIKYAKGAPKAIAIYYGNEVNYLLPLKKAQVVIITKAE